MDSKNFAIGVLSTTAAVLFVGLLVIGTRPTPVFASGVTETAGDYVLTVGTSTINNEEVLYVINASSNKMIVYHFNSVSKRIETLHGIDFASYKQAKKQGANQRKPGQGRRRRP